MVFCSVFSPYVPSWIALQVSEISRSLSTRPHFRKVLLEFCVCVCVLTAARTGNKTIGKLHLQIIIMEARISFFSSFWLLLLLIAAAPAEAVNYIHLSQTMRQQFFFFLESDDLSFLLMPPEFFTAVYQVTITQIILLFFKSY